MAVWVAVLLIAALSRILGPSDLGQNLDQSKTIAFTLDIAENAHWVLPADALGEPTHKPPLINWLGAPIVMLGFHSEPALKLPALLSGLTTAILVLIGARSLFSRLQTPGADAADRAIGARAPAMALLASAAWIASPSAIKHLYFMRPDILFTALLTGAWVASITLLDPAPAPSGRPRRPRLLALSIWLLTALAILTKGPLAMVVPLYLILHIVLLVPKDRRRAALRATGWEWGIPLILILPLLWVWAADQIDPEHVRSTLLGAELGSRIGRGGPMGILDTLLRLPGYLLERFAPWSILALLACVFPPSSRLRAHPLGPAVLWVLLVLSATTLTAMNSGSYIMPAYPAGAILAVYALFRLVAGARATRPAGAIVSIAALALVTATLVGGREATRSRAARSRTGEHLKAFAQSASHRVGSDAVRFHAMGDLPIASLMGRHQAGEIDPDPSQIWIIRPTGPGPESGPEPVVVSGPIVTHDPGTGEPIDETITIGLYPAYRR